ncbi:MAG TPA: molybdopterin dinucleotide binding domain-containing protein, partial [Actinoplanes sp.]|nr:molybdopterin dinucleotide binding domain-containing protein [Actinoplanes sp.]
RPSEPAAEAGRAAQPTAHEAVLDTWHQLVDLGSLLDGDRILAGTARPPVARIGKFLAESLQVADGDLITVSTVRGSVSLPVAITDMPPRVVWLPTNSPGSTVRRSLGATAGAVVKLTAGVPGPILAEQVER